MEMASALAYLHRKRIIHTNVKPSNILVVKGMVKVADCGITHQKVQPQTGSMHNEASDVHALLEVYEVVASTIMLVAPNKVDGYIGGDYPNPHQLEGLGAEAIFQLYANIVQQLQQHPMVISSGEIVSKVDGINSSKAEDKDQCVCPPYHYC